MNTMINNLRITSFVTRLINKTYWTNLLGDLTEPNIIASYVICINIKEISIRMSLIVSSLVAVQCRQLARVCLMNVCLSFCRFLVQKYARRGMGEWSRSFVGWQCVRDRSHYSEQQRAGAAQEPDAWAPGCPLSLSKHHRPHHGLAVRLAVCLVTLRNPEVCVCVCVLENQWLVLSSMLLVCQNLSMVFY